MAKKKVESKVLVQPLKKSEIMRQHLTQDHPKAQPIENTIPIPVLTEKEQKDLNKIKQVIAQKHLIIPNNSKIKLNGKLIPAFMLQ